MKKVSCFFSKARTWMGKHKTTVALILTILFAGIHIPMLISHGIWNDEAISWSLSKQINPSNIYEVNAIEPHPLLWQIIIAPFSQNGFPIKTICIISLILVSFAVFLMLRFAPMNYLIKIIFVLSSGFFFYNPIIARDYSIVPLALTLICMTYKKRHEKVLLYSLSLVLLSQTHFLMYGLLGALVIGFILEELIAKKKIVKKLKMLLIFILPIIISIATVVPLVIGSFNGQSIMDGKAREGISYDPASTFYRDTVGTYFGVYSDIVSWTFIVILVLLVVTLLSDNLKVSLYTIAGIGFWVFTMVFIYQGYTMFYQKVSLIVLMLYASVWLIYCERKEISNRNFIKRFLEHSEIIKFLNNKVKTSAVAIICLAVAATIPSAMTHGFSEINDPLSKSAEVVKSIEEIIEENSLVIAADGQSYSIFSAAVMEQVDKKFDFYSVLFESFDSYKHHLGYGDELSERALKFEALSDEQTQELIDRYYNNYEHIYYAIRIPSCPNREPYNDAVLSKYEIVAEYGGNQPVVIYKIK